MATTTIIKINDRLQDSLSRLKARRAEDSKVNLLARMAAEVFVSEGKEEAEKVIRDHANLKNCEWIMLKDKIQKEISLLQEKE